MNSTLNFTQQEEAKVAANMFCLKFGLTCKVLKEKKDPE